jgi:hypothetical protein
MGRPITSPFALNMDMCNLQYDLMHIVELGKACVGKACVEKINMCVCMCVCCGFAMHGCRPFRFPLPVLRTTLQKVCAPARGPPQVMRLLNCRHPFFVTLVTATLQVTDSVHQSMPGCNRMRIPRSLTRRRDRAAGASGPPKASCRQRHRQMSMAGACLCLLAYTCGALQHAAF